MNAHLMKLTNNKAIFILGALAQCLCYCKCSHTSRVSLPVDLVGASVCSLCIYSLFSTGGGLAVLKLPFTSAETLACPTVPPHSQFLIYHVLFCELPDIWSLSEILYRYFSISNVASPSTYIFCFICK